MDDKDFKEVLKQMGYEEWRKNKIRRKFEVPVDPHSPMWNYVDVYGRVQNEEKRLFSLSGDQLMDQIENLQNVYHITQKRRSKLNVRDSEYHILTEKIEEVNKKIEYLNHLLAYPDASKDHQDGTL